MGKAARRKRELRQGEVKKAVEQNRAFTREELDERIAKYQAGQSIRSGEGICDFCGSRDVKWGYRTQHDPTEPGGEGGWAACDTCHNLIENGRHESLARRSARQQVDTFPELSQIPFKALVEQFQTFHDRFREARRGPALPNAEYIQKYERPATSHFAQFMEAEGINHLLGAGAPGENVAQPTPSGSPLLHRVQEGIETHYMEEGFTAEQLSDPRTVDYILNRIKADRPTPNIPLTVPISPTIREWVGARTYKQACAAVYGETPRADDLFPPKAPMMMAQTVLEPILRAHPIVLEPEQMNAIDEGDWSFTEAVDYAMMCHLPFEPLYLDFGGHQPVMVDLKYGKCQLHGAVIWRSGYFNVPTIAVAPIGGYDYLVGPFADAMIAMGISENKVVEYVGSRPGKEVREGDVTPYGSVTQREKFGLLHVAGKREFAQWAYQVGGICWLGVETPNELPYRVVEQTIQQEKIGVTNIPLVFATNEAMAEAIEAPTQRVKAVTLSGLYDSPEKEQIEEWSQWFKMAEGATEMVAKLTERALLGLYFIENAPVVLEEVPLSRPERRDMERKRQKAKDPGQIASIVVIQSKRSKSRTEPTGEHRNYTHRWERRGYFMHIHENNRHYQNRPDLVKPCHRCEREYEENLQAQREGKSIPYPDTESPDCIKKWVEPTVCGPEDLPLKKKVRIRRKDQEAA